MSEEKKIYELNDEELEKVSGGFETLASKTNFNNSLDGSTSNTTEIIEAGYYKIDSYTLYYLSTSHTLVNDFFNVIIKEYRLSSDGCYYYASEFAILLKTLKNFERIHAESLSIIG